MNRRATHMINIALKEIGLNYHLTHMLAECRSQEEVDRLIEPFKERVKQKRRDLAKKYHPDICSNGGERMKRINDACDFLLKINFRFNPPIQQQSFVFHFHFDFRASGATNDFTTSTTTYS